MYVCVYIVICIYLHIYTHILCDISLEQRSVTLILGRPGFRTHFLPWFRPNFWTPMAQVFWRIQFHGFGDLGDVNLPKPPFKEFSPEI